MPSIPAVRLLLEHMPVEPGEHVLLIGAYTELVTALLEHDVTLTIADNDLVRLNSLEKLASKQPQRVKVVTTIEPPEQHPACQRVIIVIPQTRNESRRWMRWADTVLQTGGVLVLAGANDGGIRSLISDLKDWYGEAHTLAVGQHCRLMAAIKPQEVRQPEWLGADGIAPGTWISNTCELDTTSIELAGLPGVFAKGQLDDGSRLLLASLGRLVGKRVRDVGCGSGVIGVFASQRGAATVDMSDVNLWAVASTTETLRRNNITNARVFASHLLADAEPGQYDRIISNPPFHSGKATDLDIGLTLIRQAQSALASKGELWLVRNAFLRDDDLLNSLFSQVDVVADNQRYRVIRAHGVKRRETYE